MTIRNTYAAEAWDKVYSAFEQINFTAYDYDTVKESLLQYLKMYHAEHFNDFIESSELTAVLEMFAYVAELLAYRVDSASHENFITTAQRKQSVLKLARLISYTASRNIPARGLVKINTCRTTEEVFDSLGNNLANTTITWNDPNNTNWKEQFFLVMNKSLTSRFGQPSKAFQVNDVSMQLYTFNNSVNAFRNGVFSFSASGTSEQVQMEFVPADIDENGPYERAPDLNAQFNIIYASDGKGDGSDYTGFLGFVKQGTLLRTDYTISEPTANRTIDIDSVNVNDTDVWVYRVDGDNVITEDWKRVETLSEQNLFFNNATSRKKYEVKTLENDKISLLFGDGNFSDMPVGDFQFWTRVSLNQNLMIPKNRITGQPVSFTYVAPNNVSQEFSISFSLTAAIQNNAASETIEHVRQAAPSTYYAQNRMVNGQDYNTYPLKDPTILRLKTINRTFAGQPKYIEWNDASRKYENIKLFGDDMSLLYDISADMVETKSNSKGLVDTFIEPLLQTNALLNSLVHVLATSDEAYGVISYPRRKFIEDNRQLYRDIDGNPVNPYGRSLPATVGGVGTPLQAGDGSLNEKTMIQAALDQHWYGEPSSYTTINGVRHGVISDPLLNPKDDGRIYIADLPRTIDGVNTYPPGDIGSGLQPIARQPSFGLRFNRFLMAFGNGTIDLFNPNSVTGSSYGLGDVAPFAPALGLDYYTHKPEVITIEVGSDLTTFTVISSIRGKLPNYSLEVGGRWSTQTQSDVPFDFSITAGTVEFAAGDAFVIDIAYANGWTAKVRKFGASNAHKVNLNGWWELIPSDVIYASTSIGGSGISATAGPNMIQQMNFDPNKVPNSWVFLVTRKDNVMGEVDSWSVYNRNVKVVAESLTTKFWYNQNTQIIDSDTKKPVFDKIRILRSNLDELGKPLRKADIYDVVGFVYDADGNINFNQIEILPTDTINFTQAGDTVPDNILQFEIFSTDAYEFFIIDLTDAANPIINKVLTPPEYMYISGYDLGAYDNNYGYDTGMLNVTGYGVFSFESGTSTSSETTTDGLYQLGRRRKVPAPATINASTGQFGPNSTAGLDFMWQHFSPVTHLVDPSVTNIHDAFVLTSGYYNSVMDYVKGFSDISPPEPTPLELRTSYGYLLKNKMLSDTVVLHSGKVKLLFGSKADQRFRARFKAVRSQNATFSDERIKSEIIAVIDTFFNIKNWDFGDTFYATKLIALIHQRLASQIASVVIVPTYSVNSFGSLFTIESGFDEVLQSAATVNDVEIVNELTPTVLRQIR